MKKLDTAFAVFVFVIAVSILSFNTASAQVGGYIGVFGGYTFGTDMSPRYYDYYYDDHYDMDVQETWVIGFKLGYTPPRLRFASFEFEYSYLNPDMDSIVYSYTSKDYAKIEGDAKFNNFMFNAIVKYPEGTIHPYIGGGLGFSYVDFSLSAKSAGRSASNDDTVFASQILVGVDIDLANNLSMDIGYRYFVADTNSDHDYYYEYDSTNLDYRTSIITFGLNYKF
jgi:opacity protein-like surface antigen